MKTIHIHPCDNLVGETKIPGDKSISHRALMFASLADGISEIHNLLEGHDCIATVSVMRALGIHIALENGAWIIKGRRRAGFVEPTSILDCKNSGTTMRLMAGLLSAMPFMSILDGTDQIKTRPMDRVINPLSAMGARIFGRGDNRLAPLVILKSELRGGNHNLVVKSAQVKSAIVLAGLFAESEVSIKNTRATRDHTERLLRFMGADITQNDDDILVKPLRDELSPINLTIPGDISSAAFLIVAGALRAKDGITLKNVGVNETRTGIVDALKTMGANIRFDNVRSVANEPVADIVVKQSELKGASFSGDHIVRMIDEIPVLALAATQAVGTTVIRDAHELKVKETNRIARTVESLRSLGASIEETDDGMIIHGGRELTGGQVSSFLDHRMALFLSIAGLVSTDPVVVTNAEVTDDSYPGFIKTLNALGAKAFEGV